MDMSPAGIEPASTARKAVVLTIGRRGHVVNLRLAPTAIAAFPLATEPGALR